MNDTALVFPMFAMFLLTACVLGILFRRRVQAVRSGQMSLSFFATYQGVEPEATAQASRHFVNLFEAPVLFYVACLAAIATHHVSTALLALAWLYVLLRALHSWIHLGANRIGNRLRVYFASWLVLAAMWVVLVVQLAKSSA